MASTAAHSSTFGFPRLTQSRKTLSPRHKHIWFLPTRPKLKNQKSLNFANARQKQKIE
jgi:hypothetical protein